MEQTFPPEIMVEIAKWASPGPFRAIMLSCKRCYEACRALIPIWVDKWVISETKNENWAQVISGTDTIHGSLIYSNGIIYYAKFGKILMKFIVELFDSMLYQYTIILNSKKFKLFGHDVHLYLGCISSKKWKLEIIEGSYTIYFHNKKCGGNFIFNKNVLEIENFYKELSKLTLSDIFNEDTKLIVLDVFGPELNLKIRLFCKNGHKKIDVSFDGSLHSISIRKITKKLKDLIYEQLEYDKEVIELLEKYFGPENLPGQEPEVDRPGNLDEFELPEKILKFEQ